MLVHVKAPHTNFEVQGKIPKKMLEFLHENYKSVEIIDDDEEYVRVLDSPWVKELENDWHAGITIRNYREMYNWTQKELGEKLGGVHVQNISQIERGKREVSKEIAVKLAKLFKIDLERFFKMIP